MYFKASWTMRKYFGNPWFWWVGVLIIWWIPASQESGLVDRKSDWAQTGCSRTGRKDPALTLDLSCTNHRPCRYRRPPKLQQTSRDTWAVEAVPIDRYRQVQSMYQILLGSCKFNFLLKCLTFFNSFFCIIFQYFSLIFSNKVVFFPHCIPATDQLHLLNSLHCIFLIIWKDWILHHTCPVAIG